MFDVTACRKDQVPEHVKRACASALEFVTNNPREQVAVAGNSESKGIATSPDLLYAAIQHQHHRAEV